MAQGGQEMDHVQHEPSVASNSSILHDPTSATTTTTTVEQAPSQTSSELSRPQSETNHYKHIRTPQKIGSRGYRWLRWNFGSVYRRIFSVVFAANLAVLIALAIIDSFGYEGRFTFNACATATSTNLLVSLIARNEHFVNTIFVVFGSMPKKAPLRLRRALAKVYSYGGVHSGCNTAATVWFLTFVTLITRDYVSGLVSGLRKAILIVSYAIIVLLVIILVFAHPRLRVKWHNSFENTHRLFGWTIIGLLWALVLMLAQDTADQQDIGMGSVVIDLPSFWILIYATLLVIYPWTNLRLRRVEARVLSSHAVELNFEHANVQYGQAVRLSDAPLKETHAFAVIPTMVPEAGSSVGSLASSFKDVEKAKPRKSVQGFSVIISNAGDWTKRLIQNPPEKIWVRGLPQYGVLRIAGLFNPVVIIATGSGIGPCLSLFVQEPDHPVRVLWSTRNPQETYGQAVIDKVRRADPNAMIIDTNKSGRLDLTSLAYNLYENGFSTGGQEGGATRGEAVVIISNQKVTKKLVYGLESRGVPAYGAIFDS